MAQNHCTVVMSTTTHSHSYLGNLRKPTEWKRENQCGNKKKKVIKIINCSSAQIAVLKFPLWYLSLCEHGGPLENLSGKGLSSLQMKKKEKGEKFELGRFPRVLDWKWGGEGLSPIAHRKATDKSWSKLPITDQRRHDQLAIQRRPSRNALNIQPRYLHPQREYCVRHCRAG